MTTTPPAATSADLAAWKAFRIAPLRNPTDYRPETLRVAKAKERFRNRVTYNPRTGCWVWGGPVDYEGRPITYQKHRRGEHNAKRSAFVWMMEQWFPEVRFPDRSRGTVPVCGTATCISPKHRRGRSVNHVTKLSDAQVLQIFRQRDTRPMGDVAQEFGVSRSLVSGIWRGKHHVALTGQWERRKNYRLLRPNTVLKIYALRGQRTQQSVADEFGVSRSTIRNIWDGRHWAEVTGHKADLSREQTA